MALRVSIADDHPVVLEGLVAIEDSLAGNDLEAPEQGFRLRPPVGLDNPYHHVDAGLELGMSVLQHLVGLADAGGGADKDLQPAGAAALPPGSLQQCIRRRPLFRVAIGHKAL